MSLHQVKVGVKVGPPKVEDYDLRSWMPRLTDEIGNYDDVAPVFWYVVIKTRDEVYYIPASGYEAEHLAKGDFGYETYTAFFTRWWNKTTPEQRAAQAEQMKRRLKP